MKLKNITAVWSESGLFTKVAIVAVIGLLVWGALFGEPSVVEPVK